MDKLSKKDFDHFLGEKQYYDSSSDKNRFFKKKKGMRFMRRLVPQFVTAVLVFSVFILIINVGIPPLSEQGQTDLEIDPHLKNQIEIAESEEEMDRILEEHLHGLSEAREKGLVKEVNQQYNVPDSEINLRVEEVWVTDEHMHLMYSLPVSEEELKTSDYRFHLSELYIYKNEEVGNINFPHHRMNEVHLAGILFEDRMYGVYSTQPLKTEGSDSLKQYDNEFNVNFYLNYFGERLLIDDVYLPLKYDSSNYEYETMDVGETFSFEEEDLGEIKLDVESIETRFDSEKINLSLRGEEGINVKSVNTRFGDQTGENISQLSGGEEFTVSLRDEIMKGDQMPIQITSIGAITDKRLEFNLPISELTDRNDVKTSINVAQFKGNNIYLKESSFVDDELRLLFLSESGESEPNIKFQLQSIHQFPFNEETVTGNILRIQNSEGDNLSEDYSIDRRGDGGLVLSIPTESIGEAERLFFTIENLSYDVEVDETFEITLPDNQ
ncbi:hypothetical protein CEY16_10225 [Halalkalibacillus sediminis]|uniref:DUF4179 domain-containing protein n=1 Tax=Halalkalibacillus sediminis TaxID=2018042 RepID=A0A2I0QS16_9BACI|nr:hypothetical protein [Halalkalibacillus sediminis]PKR77114.1 hypothetical protein CEY16_10225 [Halalkalibacillus sediminis]